MEEFEKIYSLYYLDVYKYLLSLSCNRDIAEELTQETFFLAMKSYRNFRGDCKIGTWLCQIGKHAYFAYRKRAEAMTPVAENRETDPLQDQTLELKLIKEESAFEIHQLLHTLPEPYKEVFTLRVLGELPFGKIAALFDKSESWARVTYHRAKLKIIEKLEEM